MIRVRDAQGGRDLAYDVMFAFAFYAFWPLDNWMLGRQAQPRAETKKSVAIKCDAFSNSCVGQLSRQDLP
jgi:hypothetical protein